MKILFSDLQRLGFDVWIDKWLHLVRLSSGDDEVNSGLPPSQRHIATIDKEFLSCQPCLVHTTISRSYSPLHCPLPTCRKHRYALGAHF
jgi:hypothetical protein